MKKVRKFSSLQFSHLFKVKKIPEPKLVDSPTGRTEEDFMTSQEKKDREVGAGTNRRTVATSSSLTARHSLAELANRNRNCSAKLLFSISFEELKPVSEYDRDEAPRSGEKNSVSS